MPLFGNKYDPNSDLLPAADRGSEHLNYVVKQGAAVAREPKMKGHGGSIVVLPYPQFELKDYKEKNAVWPDRPEGAGAEFGNETWLFIALGVRKFGKNPVTLLYNNPQGFDSRENHPVDLIRDAAWKAKKGQMISTPLGTSDSDAWVDLLDGNEQKKQYASLPYEEKMLLCNVMLYAHGKTQYDPRQALGGVLSEPQVVWVMSRDTGKGFIEEISKLKDDAGKDYTGPLTGSKVFHFFDKKNPGTCQPRNNSLQMAAASFDVGAANRRSAPSAGGTGDPAATLGGYGTFISDTLLGGPRMAGQACPADHRSAIVRYACAKLKPWEEVLRGHTPDECARVIGNSCGLPYSLLYHAWKTHSHWYPDELKFKLTNPVSTSAPAQSSAGAAANGQAAGGVFDFGFGGDQSQTQNGVPANGEYPMGSTPWDGPVETAGTPDQTTPDLDMQKAAEAEARFRAHVEAQKSARGA